jgi:CBS domain-containing protein
LTAKDKWSVLLRCRISKSFLALANEILGVIAYDLMRPPPPCVTPNQSLLEVLPVVLASEQRNIPVVKYIKENRLVGALARAEVLGIFSELISASRKSDV